MACVIQIKVGRCCFERSLSIFPSSPRRGGRDLKKISRRLPLWSGRGGDPIPQNFVEVEHHPVCASQGCFAMFSWSRSHPSSERRGKSATPPFEQQPLVAAPRLKCQVTY